MMVMLMIPMMMIMMMIMMMVVMMMIMMRRRRMLMMIMMVWMLRRKTDPKTGEAHFARACAVERSILCGKLKEKWPWTWFCSASAIEKMHMDMPQEPFCIKKYRKNCRRHLRGQRFV